MFDFEYVKDIIKKNAIAIVSIIIGVVGLIAAGCTFYHYNNVDVESESSEKPILEEEEAPIEEAEALLKVDVKGAVKKAGVYELDVGSNIQDAITMAGGVTSKGSTKNINLAKKLTDEMVIYVFTKDELENKENSNELVCEIPECECETIVVNECPTVDETITSDDEETSNIEVTGKISINSASVEELTTLDGIGESKAKAIIEYRKTNGSFKTIEEIMNVSGIGESAFEKIKDKITT